MLSHAMPSPMQASSCEHHFVKGCVHLLREHYLPKIREAVELLNDAELWARSADSSNAVGNILMHLAGNVRQHIVAGVGERHPDERNRPLEFAARGGIRKEILLGELERAVTEACDVLEQFDPAHLGDERVIQNKNVVLFNDVYHVVEHFAYHAGQIIYAVKALKNHGFGWYKHLEL